MAKKSEARDKQAMIEGTEPPKPPRAVANRRDKYLEAKREKNDWAASEKAAKEELIDAMKENGITELLIDEGAKKIVLHEDATLKIETRKDPEE
jgi:hypothetical protein